MNTQRTNIAIEDRVQVQNPTPMQIGSVLDIGHDRAFIEWEDGLRSWALIELLEVVG